MLPLCNTFNTKLGLSQGKDYRGRGKNYGRGSVENTIILQRGSASCELKIKFQPLVDNPKKKFRSKVEDTPSWHVSCKNTP